MPRLAEVFVARHCRELKKPAMRLTPEALGLLTQYDWPGNIRELGNVLERAVVLSAGEQITAADLALPAARPRAERGTNGYQSRIELAEKDALLQALREHAGDKSAAASAMGVSRSTFYARLKKHQL